MLIFVTLVAGCTNQGIDEEPNENLNDIAEDIEDNSGEDVDTDTQ